jgi:hypothetical protein
MLKIFQFYVLLLFTVGYHGNQNIFFSMQVDVYFFLNWRLQLKCLILRDVCKMVILRNQWIKEYLINLDNRKYDFWNFENYKNGHYSFIWQNQGVLNQYNLHENAKKSFCPRYIHKPEIFMAGHIYQRGVLGSKYFITLRQ